MNTDQILQLIIAMGIGAMLQSVLNFYIANRKKKSEKRHEHKEDRYKTIFLLCYAYVNYEDEREKEILSIRRPNIKTKKDLSNELKAEWANMSLFASDKVILAMKKFVEAEDKTTFNRLVLAMRKDLYGIRTKLRMDNLDLIEKNLNN